MSSSLLQYLEELGDEEDLLDPSSPIAKSLPSTNNTIPGSFRKTSVDSSILEHSFFKLNEKDDEKNISRQSIVSDLRTLVEEKYENNLPSDNYDDYGATPLMIACRDDNAAEVDRLLKAGANVHAIDNDGRTALFHSVTSSSINIVKKLLSANADPFIVAGSYERNCLHQACKRVNNAIDIVRLLLKVMGDETKLEQDKAGFIPLHLAVTTGKQDVCRVLLSSHSKEQLRTITRDYGDTALHLAARRKELNLIRILVQAETIINQINIEGQTALHIAVLESDIDSVEYLINENASANIKDKRNRTAIHIATEVGSIEIINLLIEKCHIDINQRSKDGSTLVHLAAKSGHAEVVMYYIQKGVAVRTPNREGAEALHEACKQGHVVVAKKLIENGAKKEKYTKDNYTPLHIAVRYGKYDVVQVLIGAGADVNAVGGPKKESSLHFAAKLTRYSEKLTDILVRSGANTDIADSEGDTALHVAVRVKNYSVIKILLEEGASAVKINLAGETPIHMSILSMYVAGLLLLIDETKKVMNKEEFHLYFNSKNKLGETALHYCAKIPPKIENQAIYNDLTKLLLDNHAEVMVQTLETNETPIHYCCQNGNADILCMIFASLSPKERYKAANLTNNDGWPALFVASKYGYPNIVRILLENDARVDMFDENGKGALHVACETGHTLCVELIMDKKSYVDAKTKLGATSVGLAAANGHSQLVEMLVKKYHASVDVLSLIKRSALHMASEKGYLQSCKALIQLGADPMCVDTNHAAPIHLASENNFPDIVKMFLEINPDLASLINKDGNGCAHIAAAKGSYEVFNALLKVNSTIAFAKSKTTLRTPLHLAAEGDHAEIIQLLINQGVSLIDEDKDGLTALHLAAKYGSRNAIEMFKGRMSFNIVSSKTGMTPLHLASEFDQAGSLADLLLKASASVASECPAGKIPAETEYGFTCLHYAAKNGHEAIVRQLLNSDDVVIDHPTSKKGLLPIHLAIIEGHAGVVSLLLSRSADQISAKSANGRAALHFAAGNKQLKLVQLLIGQGANIDEQDKNGWTPLHYAADSGSTEIVMYLVQMGSDSTIEDVDGKAPLTFAAKNHHLEVMSFLLLNKFEVTVLLQDKKFLGHLMICCKLNNNESAQDFILNSPAPIYTAIKLTLMYRAESLRVKDKSDDYLEIAEFCEHMTYEILHVATTYGTEELLNAVDDAKRPILNVLIDEEFKDCVAHSNVQSYLTDLWKGNGVPIEGVYSLLLALICFLCPPLWFFLCLPFHHWNKVPTIKFICHIVSHIYFIIILSFVIVVPWNRSHIEVFPTYTEWILLLWASGHFLAEITEPDSQTLRVAICLLMGSAIGTHVVAIFMSGSTRLEIMYCRDNILGVVLVTLMSQFMLFLSLNQMFGPWSVIIERLVFDVFKFLVIMFLFIFAKTLQTAVVFKQVYGLTEVDVTSSTVSYSNRYAQDGIWGMLYENFFALFGFTSPPGALDETEMITNPSFTYIFGTISFAIYEVLAVIILINMLIAMMSNTYTILDEKSDIEWKYGRAGIIRFMTKSFSIPVPANVLAALLSVLWVCILHKGCCCLESLKARFKPKSEFDSKEDQAIEKDPEVATEMVSVWDVFDWSAIADEYMLNNGIEDRYAKIESVVADMSSEVAKLQSSAQKSV
ncbi:serine/threonine-protein phosphatase 6 regulatory ankyrin repeat subunit B isoform X1 [Hydra vulgaris]|uniref:serine/threonine-protein phosphatase 6 regulatory ankyrin repeat subunit B isoform X1 n=1 Tax=Hydra vulgaris TaxID=6087 RepID=UPI001F5ED321|nr:serine/threonine-protein phosphatase 6 regulatory ankyrin repeat subunit B isoform X1 [Hydra vulgaris]